MKDLLRILIAPLVWLATFSAIYGLLGLICGHGIGGTVLGLSLPRVLLITAYALAILLQVALLAVLYHPRLASRSGFVRFVSRITGWVGLVATGYALFPATVSSVCL
ncbi:hypothetical protein SAMN04490248_11192 [Salinihabitans flavidus]|uniref:Uncharacterized protein n=1 Tax=Salinihabitans flavidus TaxID=569882 RepID=A0A1H8SBF2_9RHOB|nr:hypothetical protein [Salinihabitans flavidus]SEO76001.1 hypothetical protein SAMN04490248_11192 [Salinihabitans flavidus]